MSEVENEETVAPTRSLFGGSVPAANAVSEGSTVADQPTDTQPEPEESVEDAASFMDSLTVVEEPVTEEPEQVSDTVEETGLVHEGVSTEPEEPVEEHQSITDDKADIDYHADAVENSLGNEDAVASTEPTEDTIPSVDVTEPTKELAELDVATLKAEREKLDGVILTKQEQERRSVISQVAAVVKLYDIPLLELFKALGGVPNPRKGEKAPITHKDDQGNTWTGRGKTPKWLKDKNPDDYRV